MGVLDGGVFAAGPSSAAPSSASPSSVSDDLTPLRDLVDDIGRRSCDARTGQRSLPVPFDETAWRHLEAAGLTRLDSTESGGGPRELAVVLRGLARHAVTVPLAETDVLAGWLADRAGIAVPQNGPMTVAIGTARVAAGRVTASVGGVPYADEAGTLLLALRDGDRVLVAAVQPEGLAITTGHNAGGEPRDIVVVDQPLNAFVALDGAVAGELTCRGAWARGVQTIGALDAAVEFSVAHTRERQQFGRPLSAFQAVQHTLAGMAGETERARAAANLTVAAATEHGFDSPRTACAVAVARVTLGQVVPSVVTSAHQLHGAIGVTIEHRLWLATMRARSWTAEFGETAWYATRLGRLALAADDPWDLIVGRVPY